AERTAWHQRTETGPQKPIGEKTVEEVARPRRASSRATPPPMELPATWKGGSTASSTASAKGPTVEVLESLRVEVGVEVPKAGVAPKPGRATAMTENCGVSSGRSGDQTCQRLPRPCRSTRGGPWPSRCIDSGITGMVGLLTARQQAAHRSGHAAGGDPL